MQPRPIPRLGRNWTAPKGMTFSRTWVGESTRSFNRFFNVALSDRSIPGGTRLRMQFVLLNALARCEIKVLDGHVVAGQLECS